MSLSPSIPNIGPRLPLHSAVQNRHEGKRYYPCLRAKQLLERAHPISIFYGHPLWPPWGTTLDPLGAPLGVGKRVEIVDDCAYLSRSDSLVPQLGNVWTDIKGSDLCIEFYLDFPARNSYSLGKEKEYIFWRISQWSRFMWTWIEVLFECTCCGNGVNCAKCEKKMSAELS